MRVAVVVGAVFLGPALVFAFVGSQTSCVAQQYDVDAGPDSGLTNCDTFGVPCAECQQCVRNDDGWRMACGGLFKNCEGSDVCVTLTTCFDRCDEGSSDEKAISNCVTQCCQQNRDDDAGALYESAANCMFHRACPFSCRLQDIHNTCVVPDASTATK